MKTLEQLGISPTPWKVSDSGKTNGCIVDAEGIICASGAPHGYPSANARLIAAAPDLYEALRMYQETFEEIRKSAWFLDANFHEIMNLNKVMTAAEAALEKAGGAE